MALPPRVVIVRRHTELDELIARHSTRGQAAFFLSSRGRRVEDVEARHAATEEALATVAAAVPVDWRRGQVERDDLPRFLFGPEDIVVVVGQDGLVANVAKYLDGQPVIGVNTEPERNPGVLVPHRPSAVASLLRDAAAADTSGRVESRPMAEAVTDDGQRLVALNEIYVGHPSHQAARYLLAVPDGRQERQASSGLIASTGTGATGWCRSIWRQRRSGLALPHPVEHRLAWFVREAWPSPGTGTDLDEGDLTTDPLTMTAESDQLVAFGDGIESDALRLSWSQTVELRVAERRLRLLTA
ncbi:NAD(+)/NADH kinase [Phytoactinopolyspora halotolerans]|uniref:NAD kinase n=1 Tax=Phytoactinopolyspora halotolerans TaxID=1981512 RepID=A0A6L9SG07_9ACTN|nr:NAD(+)/NADH kinase [Phytoactinopolyspora halotolerans]NEE03584.1 hypothetical protein [Phytoactinopolyspora halotolerans]